MRQKIVYQKMMCPATIKRLCNKRRLVFFQRRVHFVDYIHTYIYTLYNLVPSIQSVCTYTYICTCVVYVSKDVFCHIIFARCVQRLLIWYHINDIYQKTLWFDMISYQKTLCPASFDMISYQACFEFISKDALAHIKSSCLYQKTLLPSKNPPTPHLLGLLISYQKMICPATSEASRPKYLKTRAHYLIDSVQSYLVCMYVYVYAHIYMYICIYIYVYICMYTCIYAYIHVHTYMYIFIYTYV